MSSIPVRITGLRKSFPSLDVIAEINLEARQGEITSLLGPSGCGKSTLFNLISGIEKDYSGEILLHDTERREAGCLHVGYMLQKDLLLPWRNIEQNILLPTELKHLETHEKKGIDELFELFGLEDFRKAYPAELSGGMRQRANLLRTYTLKTDILLLDEPFGALDALTKTSLHHWFLAMASQKPRCILFITHDIREAITLGHSIYVLGPRPTRVLRQYRITPEQKHGEAAEKITREIYEVLQSETE